MKTYLAFVPVLILLAGCTQTNIAAPSNTQDNQANPPAENVTEQSLNTAETSNTQENGTTVDTSMASSPVSYTMEQIQEAHTASKCWTAVEGKVYDVTPAISKHPGGPARILSMCGKDSTAAFSGQHGGQQKPEQMLQGMQIGILK